MKILLTITILDVGGAERLLTALADKYAAAGHRVVLVRLQGDAIVMPKDPRVKLENLDIRRGLMGGVIAMWRMRKLIKSFKPDVINSHLVHGNILLRLLRLFVPMPRLISSVHNTNEGGGCIRILAYRLTDRLADISTNVSAEAVQAYEEKGALRPGRMLIVRNGIDTDIFYFRLAARQAARLELGLSEETPLLLAVGRLREQKDYPNLLRAFANLTNVTVLPQLAIVGDGSLRGNLAALAESLGVGKRVHFLGVRHDVADLMCACDVFVLSSAWEGFGLVVAEAMACKRVVVATDCGGVREVIGEAGFLVPPKDSSALTAGIHQALQISVAERERMGRAACQRVAENFSIAATADCYMAIYEGNYLKS